MTRTYSQRSWIAHYLPKLLEAGVQPDDARVAAHLGMQIVQTHQACYGIDSEVPCGYRILPESDGVIAVCFGRRFGNRSDGYIVHPTGLAGLVSVQVAEYAGHVASDVVLASLAVHEVRHHVQDVEAATLRMFRRDQIRGVWTDPQAAVVAAGMEMQYREEEQQTGEIRADIEFDADVVERLFIHRAGKMRTAEDLAALVRMDSPYVSP